MYFDARIFITDTYPYDVHVIDVRSFHRPSGLTFMTTISRKQPAAFYVFPDFSWKILSGYLLGY